MISIGLRIDLENNSVSGLDLFEDFVGVNWLDEDSVVVESLLLFLSKLGGKGLNGHWFGGSLLSGSSVEFGFVSDLNSSLDFSVFDLGWLGLVFKNLLNFTHGL